MSINFFLVLFCAAPITLYAQYEVEGKVIDINKQPLAFVNITIAGTSQGTSTDIDGKFKLSSTQPIGKIALTYVGYEPLTYIIKNEESTIIKMQRKTYDLSEIEILPGINPAHRIIKQATKNRDKNNPDKIQSYICKTYSKTYYDLVYNDNESKNKTDSVKIDSLKKRKKNILSEFHLMMMESITERKYLFPYNLNEKVIATKVSGFKHPTFSTTATDLQPFSFYDDYFKILEKEYLNPITSGSTIKYFFNIEDTLYQKNDTVYVISYRPLKDKNFDGLEGILNINTHGYAIQNVIASPYDKSLLDIKIQQQYSLIENQWFPEQLKYELHYKEYPSKYRSMKIYGKSYISDVKLNTGLKRKDFGFETVKMDADATNKNEVYWQTNRPDTLNNKEKTTYRIIDSLGKKNNFDQKLKIVEALSTLEIPVSIINIDLKRIISLNKYENIRLGMGISTNDRLSRWFSIGGYIGYGFKDSVVKYGGNLKINFKRNSKECFLKYEYSHDLNEPGKTQYFYSKKNSARNLLTYRMDYIELQQLSLNFRALKFLTANIALNKSIRLPNYDYLFLPYKIDPTEVATEFKSSEIRVKGRYAYKEQLVHALGQLLPSGTKYPIVYFSYTKGLKIKDHGNYDYNKFSLGIERSFTIKNLGRTHILLEGAYLKGNVPYSFLFNGNGAFDKKQNVYVNNNFQTMKLYEFLSDRYVNLFFSHNFGSLLIKRDNFQPQFIIFSGAAYGSLNNPEQHQNLGFKTMEKGFFESGLLINNIVRRNYNNMVFIGLGGGAFTRYGSYAYPKIEDNIAYKVSLTLSF